MTLRSAAPIRINFVLDPLAGWEDVAAPEGKSLQIDDLAPRIRMGREIWIIQAFQTLRQRGWPVTLQDELDPSCVNILHADDLRLTPDLWKHFVVTVRADRDPAFVSQMEIVQNRSSIWRPTDVFIPHWPQPGLVARDPSRGHRFENLIYLGNPENLAPSFAAPSFRVRLSELGVSFTVKSRDWWDYRAADGVLAIRSGSPFYRSLKPASKLVNAWLAGCPAILGPEAAYREMGSPPEDFIEARSPADVLRAASRLRTEPDHFMRIALRGQHRARDFTRDRVADRWVSTLVDDILPAFERWSIEVRRWHSHLRGAYLVNRVRKRIWGTRAVPREDPAWKEPVSSVRMAVALGRIWPISLGLPPHSPQLEAPPIERVPTVQPDS